MAANGLRMVSSFSTKPAISSGDTSITLTPLFNWYVFYIKQKCVTDFLSSRLAWKTVRSASRSVQYENRIGKFSFTLLFSVRT